MSKAAPIRHALLISGDTRFHEATERVLRAAWPGCTVHRAHPGGDPTVLRLVLAEAGTIAVLDRRFPLKLEVTRLIGKLPSNGGSVVAVSAVPRNLRDMQEVVFDDGFALLSHNLAWDSPRIAMAIVAARDSGGLAAMLAGTGEPKAAGKQRINDSLHKSTFVEYLAVELGKAGVQRTRRGKIASVVDELLMNALYHAAKDEGRRATASVEWQVDGKGGFRATVIDEFGTYSREEAHRKLVNFLANDMVEVTQTAGRGGGVGLYLVFKVSAEYHLYVDPGHKTEISIRIETAGKTGQGLGTGPGGARAQREILVYFAPFPPKH